MLGRVREFELRSEKDSKSNDLNCRPVVALPGSLGYLSSLSRTNLRVPQVTIRRSFGELDSGYRRDTNDRQLGYTIDASRFEHEHNHRFGRQPMAEPRIAPSSVNRVQERSSAAARRVINKTTGSIARPARI